MIVTFSARLFIRSAELPRPPLVGTEPGAARCGRYRHRGHWYHLRNHVHGSRCGHVFAGGVWVLRR